MSVQTTPSGYTDVELGAPRTVPLLYDTPCSGERAHGRAQETQIPRGPARPNAHQRYTKGTPAGLGREASESPGEAEPPPVQPASTTHLITTHLLLHGAAQSIEPVDVSPSSFPFFFFYSSFPFEHLWLLEDSSLPVLLNGSPSLCCTGPAPDCVQATVYTVT